MNYNAKIAARCNLRKLLQGYSVISRAVEGGGAAGGQGAQGGVYIGQIRHVLLVLQIGVDLHITGSAAAVEAYLDSLDVLGLAVGAFEPLEHIGSTGII